MYYAMAAVIVVESNNPTDAFENAAEKLDSLRDDGVSIGWMSGPHAISEEQATRENWDIPILHYDGSALSRILYY